MGSRKGLDGKTMIRSLIAARHRSPVLVVLAASLGLLTTATCTPNARITIERPQFKGVVVTGLRVHGPCGSAGPSSTTGTMTFRPLAADAGVGEDGGTGSDGGADMGDDVQSPADDLQ